MADRRDLARVSDAELEAALGDLAAALAWPAATTAATADAGDDPAARARRRIVADGVRPSAGRWWVRTSQRRSVRSSLVLATVAILLIAALAAAIGLGLPGIRITFTSSPRPPASPAPTASPGAVSSGGASPSARPSPSSSPGVAAPGWQLGLGDLVAVDAVPASEGFPLRLPSTLPAPASAWNLDGRLSLVWPTSTALPPLEQRDLGLILTEFRGGIDAGYFDKLLVAGTTIEPITVDGVTGYWISGRPHEIIFVDPSGTPVFDSRRVVGTSLIWARDGITYRLETALDRDAAVRLADSLR